MWLAVSAPPLPIVPGTGGKVWMFGPALKQSVDLPANCSVTAGKPSFAKWIRGRISRIYINGASSENLVFTEQKQIRRLVIQAPTQPIVNTATPTGNQIGFQLSGTGITGEIVLYLRYYDQTSGRRSPLSGPSPTTTFTNDGVSFTAIPENPDSEDAGITHIEVWASQDGGLPRFWFRRDIGASAFSGNETSLGEADFGIEEMPVCTYNAIYRDRLVMAGDARNPDRVYFSSVGVPEEYEGLWIATRNGEKVIGIFVVRDILVIQCENSHYYVQGFDETDIEMNVLEPFIGGLGHHTITLVDRMAIFPSRSQWYMCNGTSVTPIGQRFSHTWAEEQHWVSFSGSSGRYGWVAHDSENRLLKYKAPLGSRISPKSGLQSVNGASIYWILDYSGLVDGDGGVELLFDTAAGLSTNEPTSAAMLTSDNGETRLYTGHASGDVAIENIHGLNDLGDTITHSFQTPQIEIAAPGDDADCATIVKLWLLAAADDVPLSWTLFAGNQYDWQAERIFGQTGGRAVTETISAGVEQLGTAYRVYRDRMFLNAEQASGSTVSLLVQKIASTPYWSGNDVHPAYTDAPLRADGSVFPAPILIIRGWGMTVRASGEASRGVRPYEEA